MVVFSAGLTFRRRKFCIYMYIRRPVIVVNVGGHEVDFVFRSLSMPMKSLEMFVPHMDWLNLFIQLHRLLICPRGVTHTGYGRNVKTSVQHK